METLTLCWMFDNRWFWGLNNPLGQFLLLIPAALNIACLIGVPLQRKDQKIQVEAYFITLMTLFGLLLIFQIFLLLKIYVSAEQEMHGVTQNQEAIRLFMHETETQTNTWSWVGLIITLLMIAQIVINKLYLNFFEQTYSCLTNKIRFWIDIACLAYVGFIIFTFFVCKICFLLVSWKNPEYYLQKKEII